MTAALLREVDSLEFVEDCLRRLRPLLRLLGQKLQDQLLEVGRAVLGQVGGSQGGVLMCWEITAVGSEPWNGGLPVTIS